MKVHKGFYVVLACFFTLFLFVTEGYSYTIDASAGSGGSISPSGAVPVTAGANQTFTITPDFDNRVFDVLVDGVSEGPTLSYTFSNVTVDHSIEASFSACDNNSFPVFFDGYGYYDSIMLAYDDAFTWGLNNITLMLMAGSLPEENLYFNANILVRLEGGYDDCSFLNNSMATGIAGSLTIAAGTVIPSNLGVLAAPPCVPGDPNNFPGNPEICDGLDNNCNGLVDDGLGTDADGDGHYTTDSCILTFTPNDDCDDSDPNNYPGTPETCDSQDNNCDYQVDEGLSAVDADVDDYSAIGSCGGTADDCNDNDPGINPGATEILGDGIDQDCDGQDLIFFYENDCFASNCHGGPYVINTLLHQSVAAPDGTCASCHAAKVSAVLPGHYGETVKTADNNMAAGAIISCTSCHDYHDPVEYDIGGANIVWPKVSATWNGSTYVNLTCDTCHENRAEAHTHHSGVDNEVSYNAAVDTSQASQQGCAVCHHDYDTVNNTSLGLSTWETILVEHDLDGTKDGSANTCINCHAYDGSGSAPLAAVQSAIASGNLVTCASCHTDKVPDANHAHDTGETVTGTGCEPCHGHDNGYEYSPGLFSQGSGSFQSHSTHTEGDIDDLKGPDIACDTCHDTTNYPFFNSGTDSNGDGFFDLSETDVCDNCHSPDGSFDGVDDATIGARPNWVAGVYTGSDLTAGKEKWCVSCHDLGTSFINGRQAPDAAGDNTNYGYYVSGHGGTGAPEECGACHGLDMDHNFDGQKTYLGEGLDDTFTQDPLRTYKLGFRLKDVDGMDPLVIPLSNTVGYDSNSYKLCYSCHDEETLMSDTKSHGCYNDQTNPYKNAAAITTQFRNMHKEGHDTGDNDMPANFHADHLIDAGLTGQLWYSNGPGSLTGRSANTCITCHNPHGDKRSDNSATLAMTVGAFEVVRGSDAYGDYGEVTNFSPYAEGSPEQRCLLTCHTFGGNGTSQTDTNTKWYYNSTIPDSIALADNNNEDPGPADSGFTNKLDIRVRPVSLSFTPTEISCNEDNDFTIPIPWDAYATPYIYNLDPDSVDGSITVYCKTRNTTYSQESAVQSATITLDREPPLGVLNTTLTSPNGAEIFAQGSIQDITWNDGDFSADTTLKASPVTLDYSTDSGATFPTLANNNIATEEDNDGTYAWELPLIESNTVQVRITVTDQAGNQSYDTSDADFTIQLP